MRIKKGINKLVDRVEKTNIYIIFAIVLFVQIVFMVYYCDMKQEFFVDEIWSYGLSNSYYKAQLWDNNDLNHLKISADLIKNYLTVNPTERFKFGSVIYNQTHDAHPPLFYMVLHFISSMFPETFSKWYGLIPNIFYFCVAMFLLMRITRCLSKNNILSVAVLVLYGFSIGAVNTVTYVRMYMLLTLWCLLFLLQNIKLYQKDKVELRDIILLIIATFGGLYTHFFFIIFACPIVCMYLLYVIKEKEIKKAVGYIVSGSIGGIAALGLFPTYLNKLSGNDGNLNSTGTHSNIKNFSDWGERIGIYWKKVSSELFGSLWIIILIIIAILFLACFVCNVLYKIRIVDNNGKKYLNIENNNIEKGIYIELKKKHIIFASIIITVTFYFVLVAKITVYMSNRFVMCIYPLAILIMSVLIWKVLSVYTKCMTKRAVIFGIVCVLIGGLTYFTNDPEYLYADKGDNTKTLEAYTDKPVVYVYASAYRILDNALNLMRTENDIYQTKVESLKKNIKNIDNSSDEMILYVDTLLDGTDMSVDECAKYVKKELNYKTISQIGNDEMSVIYCLKR